MSEKERFYIAVGKLFDNTYCLGPVSDFRDIDFVDMLNDLDEQLAEKDKEILKWKDGTMICNYEKMLAEKDKEIEKLLEEQSLLSELNRDNIIIVKQLNDPNSYISLEEYEQKLSKKDKEIEILNRMIKTLPEHDKEIKQLICEKIRKSFEDEITKQETFYGIDGIKLNFAYIGNLLCEFDWKKILDQIEKGE